MQFSRFSSKLLLHLRCSSFILLLGSLVILMTVSDLLATEPVTAKKSDPSKSQKTKPEPTAQQQKDEKFIKMLSGVVLEGHFLEEGVKGNQLPQKEKYTITKVSKIKDNLFLFQARIEYGEKDITVPLPIPVQWAGDTPMISLKNMGVPGLGTFSARVVFHDGQYAGIWSSKDHRGTMFGKIVTLKKAADKKM